MLESDNIINNFSLKDLFFNTKINLIIKGGVATVSGVMIGMLHNIFEVLSLIFFCIIKLRFKFFYKDDI